MKKLLVMLIGIVRTGFSKFNAEKLASKASDAYNALLTNTNFPTPVPDLDSILALITALETAIDAASNGDRKAIKIREQARLNLAVAMKALANYVNFTSNGSLEVAATSGMDLYKTRGSVTVMPITRLKVESLPNTNTLTITAVGGKGAKSFMHQYTTDAKMEESGWQTVNCTTRKCTVNNLVPNTMYIVRVIGIGARGQQVISDPVSRIVQ